MSRAPRIVGLGGGGGGGSGAVATDAIWDAKGDLAVGTGANTAAKLTVGSNGQVLTADSAEATGLKYATVSATPGGSTTQVQYNNAGAFAGDANFLWDGTYLFLNNKYIGVGSSSSYSSYIAIANAGETVAVGDTGGQGNNLYVVVDDGAKAIVLHSTQWVTIIGDDSLGGNLTLLTVDDTNQRIVLNTPKPVIGDNSGSGEYHFDAGTGTYWQWQSINGVWTGTDTSNNNLP